MREFKCIFWDFDGVIKESTQIKANAFAELFKPFGSQVVHRILEHQISNGGMSRYEKIPLYLGWANQTSTAEKIAIYCEQFSCLVVNKVTESPWVAGVENYLRNKCPEQIFILVTATPQNEIEYILESLGLEKTFFSVFGSPVKKGDAISQSILSLGLVPKDCLVIGDSLEDYMAAESNEVPFLLRETEDNQGAFFFYSGPSIKDFSSL